MGEYVVLNSGHKMPLVGLGTWRVTEDKELENGMEEALKAGYRHFDTAYMYQNEAIVGRVLEKWMDSGKVKREELFVTSKLPSNGMTPEKVRYFLKKSLDLLRLDYVDLYLTHSPIGVPYESDNQFMPMNQGKPVFDKTDLEAVWKAMEQQVDAGLAKSIGVSSYNISKIERMMKIARIPPANNQVELHAYFQQKPLVEACKKHRIVVTAFSPLGSPGRKAFMEKMGVPLKQIKDTPVLEDPVVKAIAERLDKSTGRVLLRFAVQEGIVVVPKSASPTRLKQNFDIFSFTLDEDDMEALRKLDRGLDGRVVERTEHSGPM